ncbi:HEAT repeat domain-containing protein [Streptomyces sp. NPDC020983]|uniref:HEAT repeat domain-containing protein n=1 Tax=Streptomyces sp. NPDC020983 TaxID=3365106 RepID=UPI0037919BFA
MPNDDAAPVAAVRARDVDAAEALLAAGAAPDARDGDGYTLLGIAAVQADTAMCELLVRSGAHPDLRCPGGRTPVMPAADGGALGAFHALLKGKPDLLLRDEQGRDAAGLARAWLGADPAAELLRRLGAADGDGAVITRGIAPYEDLGPYETVRVTTPAGTASVQTGHAAILTCVEEMLGIRVPYGELADRALAFAPGHACRFTVSHTLCARMDDETLALAAQDLEGAADPGRRRFAAEVLQLYGMPVLPGEDGEDGEGGEAADRLEAAATEVLSRRVTVEEDPGALAGIVHALGLHYAPGAVPDIVRHAGHPDREVRLGVAGALQGMIEPGDTAALRAISALAQDADPEVRTLATITLSDVQADTPAVRVLLVHAMADADPDIAVQGARGLGLLGDPRADIPLVRSFLGRGEDAIAECHPAYDAIRRMSGERFAAARAAVEGRDAAAARPG